MALAKFSKFKKERAVIKEARSKEMKIKKFNKMFNEKLAEMGVSSVADLSEDQVNKLLSSLATEPVNEDRMREIEKDVIIAGTPKDAGQEAEVAKKHTFTSPQAPDQEAEAEAEDMKAEEAEEVDEAEEVTKADLDKVAKKAEDAEKKAEDAEKKADDAEDTAKDAEKEAGKGDEIKNDKEFEEYATAALKKAHPKDFDEKIAKKVIDGLKKKHDGDYGAMVGALTSGFGG